MNYEFGKLEDGINAAAKLIATAHSTYTPVFIDDGIEQFKNIKAIEDSIENFHPALFSSMKSVKKQSIKTEWVHNGICDFLRRHAIGNLLIIGFNRSFCVAKAASQISGYYGVNIMIGLPLLFGHNAEYSVARDKHGQFHAHSIHEQYYNLHDVQRIEWQIQYHPMSRLALLYESLLALLHKLYSQVF